MINNALKDASGNPQALGLVDGHSGQIVNQLIGVGIAWVLAIVGTLVILKVTDLLVGVRVSIEEEREGLDISMHGEEGLRSSSRRVSQYSTEMPQRRRRLVFRNRRLPGRKQTGQRQIHRFIGAPDV